MMKKMIMALCMFICVFTLVACSGQQTNEPLTLGVNAIITEIDKENKIITTKDSGEEGVLGDDCLIDAYSARTAHPFQRNGAPFRFKLSKAQQVD